VELSDRIEAELLRMPWRVMLSEPVAVADKTAVLREAVLAAVPILGTWSGWLTVRCDVGILRELAARIRAVAVVGERELEEAARWLVSALAAPVQRAVDVAAKLGTPSTLDGTTPWPPTSCRLAARIRLQSGDRPITIALYERLPLSVRKTGAFPSDLEPIVDAPELAVGAGGDDVPVDP
jgi:hypothetical protein